MPIRFHLDENVDRAVALGLRSRGIDVSTTVDANLIAAEDEKHLEFALGEERVVVTHDPDFLRLHASGVEHCGIAFCANQSRSVSELISGLVLIHDCCEPSEMRGQVEYL